MITPIISVIVPVYKTERYLQECIDSILAQSFTDFELILVNDGSPDKCGIICDLNAEQDQRIRTIHQKNQGEIRARANGVKAAKGEFITFVDSDDTLYPNALESLIAPTNSSIDIVLGTFKGIPSPPEGIIKKGKYREMAAIMEAFHIGSCAKLYRRSLFNDEVFDIPSELKLGPDAIMNIRIAYRVTGMVYFINKVIYQYRQHETSVTHTLMRNPEMDMLLQKLRLSSIPADDVERFLPIGLANNLILFWMSASCHVKKLPPSTEAHHKYLWNIRKYSNLKLGFYPTLLFYCRNTLLRTVVISLRDMYHYVFRNHCHPIEAR